MTLTNVYPYAELPKNALTEIVNGVHLVDGVNANSYLFMQDDNKITLIDTGISADGRKIMKYVERLGIRPSDISTIVLTHCHVDHARGARALKKQTGAKLAVHEADASYVEGSAKYPMPGGTAGIIFRVLSPFLTVPRVEPDIRLREGDALGRLKVVHTPGYTPGSIGLYDQGRKVVFVGDTVRCREGKLDGPPKHFTGNMEQDIESIKKISDLDFDALLSGHGEPLLSPNAAGMVRRLAEASRIGL